MVSILTKTINSGNIDNLRKKNSAILDINVV